MLFTGNLNDVEMLITNKKSNINIDEIWYIVRSLKPFKNIPGIISKHCPSLSPSKELFFWKESLRRNNKWNKQIFDEEFTPKFLKEMENTEAASSLKELKILSNKKNILLICYCSREDMCHRSLIKKIIENKKT